MKRMGIVFGGVALGLLAVAVPAQAVQITGQLVVSGRFTYDNLVIESGGVAGAAGLDFSPSVQLPPPPNQPTEPIVTIDLGLGYFAATLPDPTVATIKNITDFTPPTSPNYAYLPNGVDLTATPFQGLLDNFVGAPGLRFDVTQFVNQVGPGCPTVPTCAEGPFLLTQSANGFDITFDFLGFFINTKGTPSTADDDFGKYSGHFVTSIAGLTFQELFDRLVDTTSPSFGQDIGCANTAPSNNGNTEACGFTATFSPISEVPEPATLLTFGLGSALLARARRRKKA